MAPLVFVKFPNFENFQGDEQQQDETDEQFEERVLNKRAYQMFISVRGRFLHTEQLTVSDMCAKNSKKQVKHVGVFLINLILLD